MEIETSRTRPARPVDEQSEQNNRRWWAIGAIGCVGTLITAAIWTSHRGVAEDPRIANPDPHPTPAFDHAVDVGDGVLRNSPLWGFHHWTILFTTLFVVVAVSIYAWFGWKSWRQRRIHPLLAVAAAVTLLSVIDPFGNWATYTTYDPRFSHFPTDWAYFRLAPLIEPLMVIPGYPFWWIPPALFALWVNNRFIRPRISPGSFLGRHPLITVAAVGLVVGLIFEVLFETVFMHANIWIYAQYFGPSLSWSFVKLPVFISLFQAAIWSTLTVCMWKDDSGRSTALRQAQRFRVFAARPILGEIAGVWTIMMVVILTLLTPFVVARINGWATNVADPWPYPETATHDPNGSWQKAGEPGPYYGGTQVVQLPTNGNGG